MKLLVVKPTALGDVAQALLVVPELKRGGFCRDLHWLVDADYAPLVRACPAVDGVVEFPRRHWRGLGIGGWWRWLRELGAGGYDAVLDLQGLARSAVMTRAAGARAGCRRVGLASAREGARWAYTEVVEDGAVHAVDRYARSVEYLTGRTVEPGVHLVAPSLPAAWGLEKGNYTVLHPYSQREEKLWPWQRFDILAREVPGETFVLAGRGEFFPVLSPNVVDLRNLTDMAALLALLGNARAVISTDSGPCHVAAALGVPVVALFGASSPERTGPRGTNVRVLGRAPEVGEFGARRVLPRERAVEVMGGIGVEEVGRAWREVCGVLEVAGKR